MYRGTSNQWGWLCPLDTTELPTTKAVSGVEGAEQNAFIGGEMGLGGRWLRTYTINCSQVSTVESALWSPIASASCDMLGDNGAPQGSASYSLTVRKTLNNSSWVSPQNTQLVPLETARPHTRQSWKSVPAWGAQGVKRNILKTREIFEHSKDSIQQQCINTGSLVTMRAHMVSVNWGSSQMCGVDSIICPVVWEY